MRGSLRLRLLLAGAATISLALLVTGWALSVFFERHVERVARAELEVLAGHVVAGLEPGGARPRMAAPPADPRYGQPYSGLYWQVETMPGRVERSRSLWDYVLPWPEAEPVPGAPRFVVLPGPTGGRLLVLDQRLNLPGGSLRVAVAVDRTELDRAAAGFRRDLAGWLAVLAVTLFAAAAAQVAVGLRPLQAVRARVESLARRPDARLGEDVPREVLPLAREIDGLLAAREAEVERARLRAADLAHGLKTPLQALLGEAERLSAAGQRTSAEGIEAIAGAMQRHVDAELIRARMAARREGAAADPQAVVRAVVGVLSRTPIGAELDWRIHGQAGQVALDPSDLAEAVGALAENAARHAASRVEIALSAAGAEALIAVSDDGAGIPATALERIRERGVRLDQRPDGTGLGLAIAGEIADAAGGRLALGNLASGTEGGGAPAGLGGLRATLHLPLIP